jgi:hypothetical protein
MTRVTPRHTLRAEPFRRGRSTAQRDPFGGAVQRRSGIRSLEPVRDREDKVPTGRGDPSTPGGVTGFGGSKARSKPGARCPGAPGHEDGC